MKVKEPFSIGDRNVAPGKNAKILYKFSNFYTNKSMNIPIHVHNGAEKGPKLFIFGALHGDELNGIEIINRLHQHEALTNLYGTLITVPVVNPFGLIQNTRELATKDLNRSFPGSKKGNLSSRLAFFYTEEIIKKCDYGIDLHSGGNFLFNEAHIRTCLQTPHSKELALNFGVPVVQTDPIKKSLRKLAKDLNIPLLVYESGEASRIDFLGIEKGLQGVLNILASLKMIEEKWKKLDSVSLFEKMKLIRSPRSGLLLPHKKFNNKIQKNQVLGEIVDPFDMGKKTLIKSLYAGELLGRFTFPLVNEGDPLFHIAIE